MLSLCFWYGSDFSSLYFLSFESAGEKRIPLRLGRPGAKTCSRIVLEAASLHPHSVSIFTTKKTSKIIVIVC